MALYPNFNTNNLPTLDRNFTLFLKRNCLSSSDFEVVFNYPDYKTLQNLGQHKSLENIKWLNSFGIDRTNFFGSLYTWESSNYSEMYEFVCNTSSIVVFLGEPTGSLDTAYQLYKLQSTIPVIYISITSQVKINWVGAPDVVLDLNKEANTEFMDRLFVISSDSLSGSSFAQMKCGLSYGQYKVITTYDEANAIPGKVVFIHDTNHPTESVAMQDCLLTKGGFNMKDQDYLDKVMSGLYNDIQEINSLFTSYNSDVSTKSAIEKLKDKFSWRGLVPASGFEYTIGRDITSHCMYFIPKSNWMTVFYNLYKGYVYRLQASNSKLI